MADVVTTPARAGGSYVEWSAVFAGGLAASAISFVLLTAGAAVGLSLVSPYGAESYPKTAATIAVFWSIAVPILSFLVGGYIAGRMRHAWADASSEEVQFRDGMHGLLVWALGIFIAAMLAAMATGGAVRTGTSVASGAMSNESVAIAPVIDTMFGAATPALPNTEAPGTPPAAAAEAGVRASVLDADARAMVARTLVAAAGEGKLSAAQKRTLAEIVSARTGLTQAEAERRVDQAFTDGMEAIETTREAAVLVALVTVTALLIGLLAAWYAAKNGGRHRDANIPARLVLSFTPTRRSPL
ncbi:conserved membrane protein of unknown function [Hyphomicrobium sp. 1Nfss2.1]|uniref:hypothetical protein n=1 Tax=Hyphomicrobium sp. 1Nfss2.1 TaxID=3413936 RepID=UPI003C7DD61A